MQYKVDELELYTFIKGSASSQTLELEVFLGGEFINLGTLYLTHD